MTRKIWVDRKGNKIEPGMLLKHLDGSFEKVTMYSGKLYIEGGKDTLFPLTEFSYDDAFDSVDLKKNECRLREFEVVSYE